MRRNLNRLINGRRTLDTAKSGELGANIPITGETGPSYLFAPVNLYSLQTSEVSARVTDTNLPVGTWHADRNGVFQTSGSIPDGLYYVNYDFSIFGRKQPGPGVLILGFGNIAPAVSNVTFAAATEGQTVTLSVTATGTPTPTYQWERQPAAGGGYVEISGAVSSSYTTPVTTITGGTANHGDTYRCIVTNSVGATTSPVARLQVLETFASPTLPVVVGTGVGIQLGF